jgi:hypothetical protein
VIPSRDVDEELLRWLRRGGDEVPKHKNGTALGAPGDGLDRKLWLCIGNGNVRLDLCITCTERAAAIMAEAFPPSAAGIREYIASPYGLLPQSAVTTFGKPAG